MFQMSPMKTMNTQKRRFMKNVLIYYEMALLAMNSLEVSWIENLFLYHKKPVANVELK